MQSVWLTKNLQNKVRQVFEPRYKRSLSDDEVATIAENLTGYLELLLKSKWRNEYEKNTQQ